CPADGAMQGIAGLGPAVNMARGTATATDDGGGTVTVGYTDGTPVTGQCPEAYSFVRTWTATDNCGATATCTQTITVVDTQAPMISCPADVTVACTADTSPTGQGSATATDNCDTAPTVTYSDVTTGTSCPQTYSIARTWTATDNCNNSTSCVQMIQVNNTPPAITCPADATIECNTSLDPAVNTALGTATATDNCGATVTGGYTDGTPGTGESPDQ